MCSRVLRRTREKLEALEARLAALEEPETEDRRGDLLAIGQGDQGWQWQRY